ncbi:MAG: UDP-N-acetylmuramoyl-L-alanine--D-glutamate ligase [Proteobacteria bacterium]|nr:UDP-N-acetylmuramoyl-L-alanine--D-glutamate ligase [Pseudomonadota bacterium]NBX86434.1 UDP-N-acetylmuramoyl-L-alanine--D-glutamate ligase [Pseudomonadota bacterium]
MAYGLRKDKAVLVYGLAGSGRAVVEKLAEAGMRLLVWDDKLAEMPEALRGLERVFWVPPAEIEWRDVQVLIKTPGVPMESDLVRAAQAAKVPVMGEIDLFWRREKASGATFIGVTGTNGKSTTTALIAHILKSAGKQVLAGGNLGVPAMYLGELESGGFYVLELSSYQLEIMQEMALDGAVFLNLTPDHLARHKTMESYRAAKQRIFDLAKPDATKVLGVDQLLLREIAAGTGAITVSVGGEAEVMVRDGAVWREGKQVLKLGDFVDLPGPHNAQNLACAFALLVPRWCSVAEFVAGAKSYRALPHRLEQVGAVEGIRFINDSKATNGDSAVYALQSYPAIYWICGGQPKTDGLGACVEHLGAVRAAFTIGEAGEDFAATLQKRGVAAFVSGTMERAVVEAFAAAKSDVGKGPVVLLSPACASFDQFRNFEHRGDVFANCVRGLIQDGEPAPRRKKDSEA